SAPLGAPPGSTAEDASSVTPRGRSMATIAVYRSSAGAMTYRGCTMGQLSTISPTNSTTLNARAVTASGQCGAVNLPSAMTTTATNDSDRPQDRALWSANIGNLRRNGGPLVVGAGPAESQFTEDGSRHRPGHVVTQDPQRVGEQVVRPVAQPAQLDGPLRDQA